MSLINYIVKRILATFPILFGVLAITFVLVRQMPGSPFLAAQGGKVNWDYVGKKEEEMGLNEPIYVQFWIYVRDIFRDGNWGNSANLAPGVPVWQLMWGKVPLTLEMQMIVTVVSSYIGIKAGVFSSVNQNNMKDTVMRFLTFVAYSMPIFWLGLIMRYIFSYRIPWFPAQGYISMMNDEILDTITLSGFGMLDSILALRFDLLFDIISHMFLPIFVLIIGSVAGLTRYVRSSMLEILELDFIRSARAKGCKEKDVVNKHALRNSMIPTVTLIGLNFGFMITGSTLTELTFNLNGMGRLYLNAIQNRDYFVIQAMVMLITGTVILANLITDILYGVLDPRIRY